MMIGFFCVCLCRNGTTGGSGGSSTSSSSSSTTTTTTSTTTTTTTSTTTTTTCYLLLSSNPKSCTLRSPKAEGFELDFFLGLGLCGSGLGCRAYRDSGLG